MLVVVLKFLNFLVFLLVCFEISNVMYAGSIYVTYLKIVFNNCQFGM